MINGPSSERLKDREETFEFPSVENAEPVNVHVDEVTVGVTGARARDFSGLGSLGFGHELDAFDSALQVRIRISLDISNMIKTNFAELRYPRNVLRDVDEPPRSFEQA